MFEVDFKKGFSLNTKVEFLKKSPYSAFFGLIDICVISLVAKEVSGENCKAGIVRQLIYPITKESDYPKVENMVGFLRSVAQNMNAHIWNEMKAQKSFIDLASLMASEESRLAPNDVEWYAFGYNSAQEMSTYSNIYEDKQPEEDMFKHISEFLKANYPSTIPQAEQNEENPQVD
jgi:hypothetical protein